MNDDDVTRDGLPRFIYGEHTGEIRLPVRPDDGEDEDAAPRPMDRNTKILLGAGGLALVFIVGLVIAALSTGSAVDTPAAANAESAAASATSGVPSPTGSPEPSQTWAMATDIGKPPAGNTTTTKGTKTTKPGGPATTTTTPGRHPTTPWLTPTKRHG